MNMTKEIRRVLQYRKKRTFILYVCETMDFVSRYSRAHRIVKNNEIAKIGYKKLHTRVCNKLTTKGISQKRAKIYKLNYYYKRYYGPKI